MTDATPITSTANGFTLRRFRPGDLDDILALNAYGLAAVGIAVSDDYYAGKDLADPDATFSHRAGGALLVGEVDEVLVAMGGIRRIDSQACELLRMRVYPEYQGRGYGGLLLTTLEQEGRRLGYTHVELITGQDQHPAVDMYARHGYRIIRKETLIGIPSVHMRKELM